MGFEFILLFCGTGINIERQAGGVWRAGAGVAAGGAPRWWRGCGSPAWWAGLGTAGRSCCPPGCRTRPPAPWSRSICNTWESGKQSACLASPVVITVTVAEPNEDEEEDEEEEEAAGDGVDDG